MTSQSRRARLILLDGVEAAHEIGIQSALLSEVDDPDGAIVAARLCGAAVALGRWQAGGPGAMRRWTGGRATHYGDGVVTLCAIAPGPQAWLDERKQLVGPRLLNRWVRGLLAGLGAMGVQAAYPGRDFVSANGRQIASLGLERTSTGRLLFHAVIAATRSCPAEPDPQFPGLPNYPEASTLAAEGGDPGALRALARGFAQRFGVELVESSAPEPGPAPPDRTPDGVRGPDVPVPIGQICAALQLASDGRITRARLLGDWIVASGDLDSLEASLVGADSGDAAALEALAARWLTLPGAIAIGVTDPRQIARALRASRE